MKLSEIFEQLSVGELSQVHIGGASTGGIQTEDYPKLVAHINMALAALFTRFRLRRGRLTLLLQPGQTDYLLKSDYLVNNTKSKQAVRYLVEDPLVPFKDDLAKVDEVSTETGLTLPIGKVGNVLAVFTPTTTTLRIPQVVVDQTLDLPQDLQTDKLLVSYRALHPKLEVGLGYFDPERVEVDLPYAYVMALCYFIASRAIPPIEGEEANQNVNNWYLKYEQECQRLQATNLEIEDLPGYSTFRSRGWV